MDLSIIIPVYNVERYVSECILSSLNQQNVSIGIDYEVIVVDDGSKDNSIWIVKNLVAGLNGITIINQKNSGLSVARNVGLDNSKGRYIWFVDSDDWIENDAVSRIVSKIKESDYDAIKLRAFRALPNGVMSERHKEYCETIVKSGREAGIEDMSNTPAQFTIYKRKFLFQNNLRFMPGVYHEDNEFTPRMYWYAEKVAYINKPLYFHRQNPNSICNTPNPKRAFDLLLVCASLSKFSDEIVKKSNFQYYIALNQFISLSLNNALNIMISQSRSVRQTFNLALKKQRYLFKHLFHSNRAKYIMESILFKIFGNYDFVYKILVNIKLHD